MPLADAAPTDPVAAASAQTFDELSPAEQQRVVDIVDDPAFAAETAIARWFGTHPAPTRSGQ